MMLESAKKSGEILWGKLCWVQITWQYTGGWL